MASFDSLPRDIHRDILGELGVYDVVRVGMTCKSLYEVTQDHHVWLPRAKELWARLPTLHCRSTVVSLSPEELKHEVISQTRLDLRWKQDVADVPVLMHHDIPGPGVSYGPVFLPGGDHFVLVFSDGQILLKGVEKKQGEFSIRDILKVSAQDFGTFSNEPIYSGRSIPTVDGDLLLALNTMSIFHVFRICKSPPSIELVKSVEFTFVPIFSHIQAEFLLYFAGYLPISLISLCDPESTARVINIERLKSHDVQVMFMLSKQTLLVGSTARISVYHIGLVNDLSPSHVIQPIWEWTNPESGLPVTGKLVSNTFFNDSYTPILHLVSDTSVHILKFKPSSPESGSELDVDDHQIVNTLPPGTSKPYSSNLSLKCSRGLWHYLSHGGHTFTFATISLGDAIQGRTKFRLDDSTSWVLQDVDFDEVSGRVALMANHAWGGSSRIYFWDML